jgi:high-affinity K+ transport system ATPase subunit B
MVDGNAILLGLTIIGVLAVLEIPVIIAYMRGVRGHKLNIVLMVTGLGALLPIWIAALVMSFVCKPITANRKG